MTTITIDNRDLENLHIDTYQMLTGDSFVEYELETLSEQYPECTYDDFDWTYDHPAIVKDFAHASINIIENAIAYTDAAKIIKSIKYVSSGSPRFYNYTTDHYVMDVEVDDTNLHRYIASNHEAINAMAGNYSSVTTGAFPTIEDVHHAAICHLINNAIEADDYNMNMWEAEMEVYMENVTIEPIKK